MSTKTIGVVGWGSGWLKVGIELGSIPTHPNRGCSKLLPKTCIWEYTNTKTIRPEVSISVGDSAHTHGHTHGYNASFSQQLFHDIFK